MDVFAELRRRLDVRQVASDLGLKTRAGNAYFQCPAPECASHKHGRLTAKCSDGETWICLADWGGADEANGDHRGDVVDLIALRLGISASEALRDAKARAGIETGQPLPPPPPPKVKIETIPIAEDDLAERYRALTYATDHYERLRVDDAYLDDFEMPDEDRQATERGIAAGIAYLESRGFPGDMTLPVPVGIVAAQFTGLALRLYAEGGDGLVDAARRAGLLRGGNDRERYAGYLWLPWRDADGVTVAMKGRLIPELAESCGVPRTTKGEPRAMLFPSLSAVKKGKGPHIARPPVPFGLDAASRMTGQWIITEGELDALSAILAGVPAVSTGGTSGIGAEVMDEVVPKGAFILFDGDAAGEVGAKRLSKAIGRGWAQTGDADLNDLLRDGGVQAVKATVIEASGRLSVEHVEPPSASPPAESAKPKPKKLVEPPAPEPVSEPTGEPPGPDDTPEGWRVAKSGALQRLKMAEDGTEEWVSTGIFFPPRIVWRGQDITDQKLVVGLAGRVAGSTREVEITVERSRIKQARSLVPALSECGIDVDDTTGRTMVRYLSDYERYLGAELPFRSGAQQMGWQHGGRAFLYGDECIGERGELAYIGEETGVLEALRPSGTMDAWRDGVLRRLEHYDIAILGFYAAMAAPLVRFVPGLSGFVLEYAGASSGGKSTVASAIASAWGCPTTDGGLMRPWFDTAAGLELYAALMGNLPLFIEDTHLMEPDRQRDVIMALANGAGKGRALQTGRARQEPRRWATVTIITAESSVAESTSYAGVGARVLSFPPPLPPATEAGPDQSVIDDIRSIDDTKVEHYGHAGRAWIRWLAASASHPIQVIREMSAQVASLQEYATFHGPQQRWLRDLSLVIAVAKFAAPVIGGRDVTERLWELAVAHLESSAAPDQATSSMELLMSWIAMDAEGGVVGTDSEPDARARKIWWRRMDDGTLCLAVSEVSERFKAQGIPIRTVRDVWMRRGWLAYEGAHAKSVTVRLAGAKARCIPVAPGCPHNLSATLPPTDNDDERGGLLQFPSRRDV